MRFPYCIRTGALSLVAFAIGGCAQLHSVQLTDLEGDACQARGCSDFEMKVSETGVSVQEAAGVAKAFTQGKAQERIGDLEAIIGLFQFGPRTGNIVFSDEYADRLASQILQQCPTGQLTSLMSIRETRKYPVVSGEIVKLKGKCVL
jgi:hypothetical protein